MAPRLATVFLLTALLSVPAFAAPNEAAANLTDTISQQPYRQWLASSGLGRMLQRKKTDLTVLKGEDGSETLVLGQGFRQVILVQRGEDGRPVTSCVSTAAEAEAFLSRRATVEKQP